MKQPATTPSVVPSLTDWNLLRSFVAVVETGSLSQAAARLGLTQPSVSRHMRELERLLGETLFDRRPSGLVPTARAQALFEVAGGMQALARRAEDAFDATSERISGVVRVTTSEAFGVHVLPAWLALLMQAEPELELELHVTQETENLLRRDADIAVRFVRPEQAGVIAKRVGRVEIGMFASADYLTRHGEPRSLEESARHSLIGPDRLPARANPIASAAAAGARFRLRTDSALARLSCIEAGMGIGPALVPLAVARPNLRRVLAAQLTFPLEIWLCSHDDLRRSARIRRVFDFLDEKLSARFGHDERVHSAEP